MNIQPYQLMFLTSYVIGFYVMYRWKKTRIPILILMAIAFFANPFRNTATSINQIERGVTRFDNIPEKIIVDNPSFDDFNKSEIDKLNKLYEETKDEIHN